MVVTSTRFLVVRVQLLDGRPPPTPAVLGSAIRDSIQENFGDYGSGLVLGSLQSAPPTHTRLAGGQIQCRLRLFMLGAARHYSPHAELCCVRVARQHVRMVRGSISLVRFIQKQAVILTVLQTCGAHMYVVDLQSVQCSPP